METNNSRENQEISVLTNLKAKTRFKRFLGSQRKTSRYGLSELGGRTNT
jgi:hypothetical protein